MTTRIRDESEGDAPGIARATEWAFRPAAHSQQTEVFIINALRRAGALSVSLLAQEDEEIVGHAAASPVCIDGSFAGWYGLGPVSVIPRCQRRGLGSRLIGETLTRLRARDAAGCVVLGDPDFYLRFGFRPIPTLILPGVPARYFQTLSFGASPPSGVVTYHPAFAATD
jgi:predicted N-acetyltransferase YhbS